jgi:pimeloyl-ACP methyl ester carboxylesterase
MAGHTALAPDLASLGRDRTPISKITLQKWIDDICRLLDAQANPVILVGHSRAGAVISQAAEECPEKVRELVYLAAYLLPDGESVSHRAQQDARSQIAPNMVISEDRRSWALRDTAVRDALYAECADEDVVLAQSLLTAEPVAPLATAIRISDERFGSVPRVYIECRRDRAVSLSEQRKMYSAMPCRQIVSMDTDHSPFFSAPDELVGHLLSLQA